MTTEELKAIENLTNEIKDLKKVLTVFASIQYAGIRCMGSDSKQSNGNIRARMRDGLAVIDESMKNLNRKFLRG